MSIPLKELFSKYIKPLQRRGYRLIQSLIIKSTPRSDKKTDKDKITFINKVIIKTYTLINGCL
ncbi:MAG: hypothetical protein ACKPFF_30270, partial [Planktothrix sp.]